jgi:hypothetical protein
MITITIIIIFIMIILSGEIQQQQHHSAASDAQLQVLRHENQSILFCSHCLQRVRASLAQAFVSLPFPLHPVM